MEDVVIIYRKVSLPNGGESWTAYFFPSNLPARRCLRRSADYKILISMGISEEKKIKYYAIDSVDVLHKLGSAAGGDAW